MKLYLKKFSFIPASILIILILALALRLGATAMMAHP